MALDRSTLDSDTPRTRDGRSYPDFLRPYEKYDDQLLPIVARLDAPSATQLAEEIEQPRLRSVLSRWMASAEWRGLIERRDNESMVSRRRYVLGEQGRTRLASVR